MKSDIMKILGFLFAMVVFMGSASALLVAPSMDAVLTSQEPFPAEPGEIVEIEVEIQNNGKGEADDVSVEIDVNSPFSLLPGEEKTKKFSIIGPESSVKISYNLHIEEDAITNDYDIEFKIFLNDDFYVTKEVQVSVQGDPKIIIESVSISPENAEAGGEAEIIVNVKNVGTGTARHFNLVLSSTSDLVPILSKGSVYMGDLAPSESGTAKMKLSIINTAEQKTYAMKLNVDYLDESGDEETKSFDIGIPVSGTVKLDVIKTEPNYDRGLLEIEVANKGTTEAKSVEARLVYNGEILDIDYISQIKPNKKTTFNFPLVMEGTGQLEINYIGPGLEENKITKDIVFDFEQGNGQNNSSAIALAVVVIIIVVGFWFWRRRRKKKKGFLGISRNRPARKRK